jgi:hypothetical protein
VSQGIFNRNAFIRCEKYVFPLMHNLLTIT